MPSPKLPAAGTVLDAKVIPLDRFDALFAKITQERQIGDGYFLQDLPDEVRLLFVVNGSPYAAGRIAGGEAAFLEIHEFFAAYAEHPEAPLSFFVADKRLLLGLMVVFRHQPDQQQTTDRAGAEQTFKVLAERGVDAILCARTGEEWAIGICTKGKVVAGYLPPSATESKGPATLDHLLGYVEAHAGEGVSLGVFEETRVGPAEDVSLVTPETRGHLSEVFLKVAEEMKEAEAPAAESALELEVEPVAAPTPPAPAAEPPAQDLGVDRTLTTGVPVPPPAPAAPAAPPGFKGPIPEIVLYAGEKQLATYTLASGELTIGRTAGNSILLENPGVSRKHAVIRAEGSRVIIEDMGSANGTFVNGQKAGTQELKDGDEIQIVKHRLVYRVPREPEAPKKAAPSMDAGKTMMIDPSAMAAAMGGKGAGPAPSRADTAATPVLRPRLILPDLKKFALETEEVSVGSGAECQIQVPGMFVAKVHARIVPVDKGQYKLIHLGGLAGTRINGERVSEHVLKHGDEIEIGGKKILFRLER
jgi:pSer/pThr/pTyr-binding forkhead associated (FHA) protein